MEWVRINTFHLAVFNLGISIIRVVLVLSNQVLGVLILVLVELILALVVQHQLLGLPAERDLGLP